MNASSAGHVRSVRIAGLDCTRGFNWAIARQPNPRGQESGNPAGPILPVLFPAFCLLYPYSLFVSVFLKSSHPFGPIVRLAPRRLWSVWARRVRIIHLDPYSRMSSKNILPEPPACTLFWSPKQMAMEWTLPMSTPVNGCSSIVHCVQVSSRTASGLS